MKKALLANWLRSGVTAAAVLVLAAVAAATAKDAPKFKISDREVDRAARGASYAPVIKRVTPSVVTIQSTRTITWRQNPFSENELFRRFFGDQFGDGQRRPRKQTA